MQGFSISSELHWSKHKPSDVPHFQQSSPFLIEEFHSSTRLFNRLRLLPASNGHLHSSGKFLDPFDNHCTFLLHSFSQIVNNVPIADHISRFLLHLLIRTLPSPGSLQIDPIQRLADVVFILELAHLLPHFPLFRGACLGAVDGRAWCIDVQLVEKGLGDGRRGKELSGICQGSTQQHRTTDVLYKMTWNASVIEDKYMQV